MISKVLTVFTRGVLCTLLLLSFSGVAHAVIETYQFSSSSLELRYKQLSAELRCPKCQNQTIADSNAPIAQDLRKLLYKQLEAGASDDEILDYMVSRYGEFVRYKPRFSGVTLMLWLMPVGLLFVAILVVFMVLRKARKETTVTVITVGEQQQLDDLLGAETSQLEKTNKAESDT